MTPSILSRCPLVLLLLVPALVGWQSDPPPSPFVLGVGNASCALAPATEPPEATPEFEATAEPTSDATLLTLGDDCETVTPLLQTAANGTIWLSLRLADTPDVWLALDTVADDPHPPRLDQRGRFFGCAIPVEGEQTCQVAVSHDEADYIVAVPLIVGAAWRGNGGTAANTPAVTEGETTVQHAVWHCRHLGSNVFEWVSVEISYTDGVAVGETVTGGPFTGAWRDGCPAGEPPPNANQRNSAGDSGDDGPSGGGVSGGDQGGNGGWNDDGGDIGNNCDDPFGCDGGDGIG